MKTFILQSHKKLVKSIGTNWQYWQYSSIFPWILSRSTKFTAKKKLSLVDSKMWDVNALFIIIMTVHFLNYKMQFCISYHVKLDHSHSQCAGPVCYILTLFQMMRYAFTSVWRRHSHRMQCLELGQLAAGKHGKMSKPTQLMCAAIPGDLPSVAGHMMLLAKRNLIFDLSIKTKMNFCRTSHSQRYCCFGYPSHGKKKKIIYQSEYLFYSIQ